MVYNSPSILAKVNCHFYQINTQICLSMSKKNKTWYMYKCTIITELNYNSKYCALKQSVYYKIKYLKKHGVEWWMFYPIFNIQPFELLGPIKKQPPLHLAVLGIWLFCLPWMPCPGMHYSLKRVPVNCHYMHTTDDLCTILWLIFTYRSFG